MRTSRALAAALATTWVAGAAAAQHYDINFGEDAATGRLRVDAMDFDVIPGPQSIVAGERVFGRSIAISGNHLQSSDPGFSGRINAVELNPAGLVALVGNEEVRFLIRAAPASYAGLGGRNLSFWDGTGSVFWEAVPDNERIQIFDPTAPANEAIADGSTSHVPGFAIAATAASGSLHKHLRFLMLPDGAALPPAGPDDGVYLLLLEGTLEPYAEWVPFFVLFNVFAGAQSVTDAAIADVETEFLRPLCDDDIDNDRDGLIDAPDPGCANASDMSERGILTQCDNGIDDDLDGFVDFPNDLSCSGPAGVTEIPEPGSTAMLASGLGVLLWLARRRRREA